MGASMFCLLTWVVGLQVGHWLLLLKSYYKLDSWEFKKNFTFLKRKECTSCDWGQPQADRKAADTGTVRQ